jgi:type II secretory pathway component PulF
MLKSISKSFVWNARARKTFYLKLAEKIENNVSPLDVIEGLYRRARSRRQKVLSEIYGDMVFLLRNGRYLSDALVRHAPVNEAMILQAVSTAPQPGAILRETVSIMDEVSRITAAMRIGLLKPVGFLGLVFVVLIFYRIEVLPEMAKSLPVSQWTGAAAILWWLSSAIKNYAILLGVLAVGLVVAIRWSLDNMVGPVRDKVFDRLPPWVIYRIYSGAVLMVTVGAMQASGRDFMTALLQIRGQSSRYLRVHIDPIIRALKDGAPDLGRAIIQSGQVFPTQEFVDDLEDYAGSPNFATLLPKISKEFLNKGIQQIEAIAQVATRLAVVLVYGTVALVVFGIFGYTFTIVESSGAF